MGLLGAVELAPLVAAALLGGAIADRVDRRTLLLLAQVGLVLTAAMFFALAGAADSVSAVCRNTINQSVTLERMRGRMSAVYTLVVTGGPRLGDIESG